MLTGSLQEKKGHYYVVTRINGKQKWFATGLEVKRGNKRAATAKMTEILDALESSPRAMDTVTVEECAAEWLTRQKERVRETTFSTHSQSVERHIIPYFKGKKLKDVKPSDVERYFSEKAKNGKVKGQGGLTKGTLQRHLVLLRAMFDDAVRDGLIRSNPCAGVRLPKMPQKEKEAQYYTKEQCEKMLRLTEGTILHDMLYITMIYGLRREELMGLRWQAIDFEEKTVEINHTATVTRGKVIRADDTKTSSSRRLYPLTDDAAEVLAKRKETQTYYRRIHRNLYHESDYVFTKPNGEPYSPAYPSLELKRRMADTDIPCIGWHALRHTCATMLIAQGVPLQDVSEWLGHKNIPTTYGIYVHPNLEHKRTIAQNLMELPHDSSNTAE